MSAHAAVRLGDERATLALLVRLARIRVLNQAIADASKSRRQRSHTLNQLLPAKHRRRAEPAGARAP